MTQEWHSEPQTWSAAEWHTPKTKSSKQKYEDIYSDESESIPSASFLEKLISEVKATKGRNALETAGNVADVFNRGVERTGLPHAARGFIQGGEDIIRGIGNLIPGVNIPSAGFGNMPIGNGQDNLWQQAMGMGGQLGALANPANTIFQGSKTALQGLSKLPNYAKNIMAGATAGGVLSPDNRGVGAATGATLSSIPEIGKLIKKGYKSIQRPYDLLRQSERELSDINRMKQKSSEAIRKAEQDVGRHLNEKNEANLLEEDKLKSKLTDVYPIIPKSETRASLVNQHESAIKSLGDEFEQRYGSFSQEHGHKPIKKTIPLDEFLQKTKDLKGLSGTMEEIIKNPAKKIIRYESSKGETKEIPMPGKNATVDDYISFMRELRDAAYDAMKASKNATYGEKQELLKTHGELKSLQDDVVNRIKESIGNHNYEPFHKIQKDYADTMGRVKSEPSISKASYGKKISDNLFSDLNQPANEKLRKYLYKQPGYKQALNQYLLQGAKHPISEGTEFNPTKIDADVHHLLSNEQRAAKAEAGIFSQKQQHLKDVSKSIKSPEKMTALQESEARKFSPEVNKFLDDVAKEKNITASMERKAEELGLSKEKFQQQIFQRKLIGAVIGASSAIGIIPPFIKKIYHSIL